MPVGAAQYEHGEAHGPLSLAEKFEGLLGAMAWVAPQVAFAFYAFVNLLSFTSLSLSS